MLTLSEEEARALRLGVLVGHLVQELGERGRTAEELGYNRLDKQEKYIKMNIPRQHLCRDASPRCSGTLDPNLGAQSASAHAGS